MKTLSMNDWRKIFKEQMQEVKPNDVWRLKMDWQLDFNHFSPGWVQVLQDQAHARFTCSQCYHSWLSYQVVILFHMNWEQKERRGSVLMKPFRQQCLKCSSEKHEVPEFTETDVTSVIHHLILDIQEKCYGEYVDRSELSEVVWDREYDGPHKRQQCEACRMGLHRKHHGNSADQHGQPQGAMHYGKPQLPISTESNQCVTMHSSSTERQAPPVTDPSDLNFWTTSMENNQHATRHSSSTERQAPSVTDPSDLNFWTTSMENNQHATRHSSSTERQAPPVTDPSDLNFWTTSMENNQHATRHSSSTERQAPSVTDPSDLNFWTTSMENNQHATRHSSSTERQAPPVTDPSDLNFWTTSMENNQCTTMHSSSTERQAPPVTESSDPTVTCNRWKCACWKCVLLTSAAIVLFVSVVLILIAYWLNWI
ncbi:receptor-transporting protein 3-like [Eublepharis macularius]|uniref:Receptor-transporting protein 3-like n=1 Tax=Eublepharis macularius TaxID=481883 RepID=A0AA97L285_EUBMA|nr:receptor-transporting protein 3-like [Eublepharis macularius]